MLNFGFQLFAADHVRDLAALSVLQVLRGVSYSGLEGSLAPVEGRLLHLRILDVGLRGVHETHRRLLLLVGKLVDVRLRDVVVQHHRLADVLGRTREVFDPDTDLANQCHLQILTTLHLVVRFDVFKGFIVIFKI